jgi:adenylate cyclase
LNLYGPAGHIPTIQFHELLRNVAGARFDLAGKVVIVGAGATLLDSTEQQDTYRTVYSTEHVQLSGAEIATTAFANLLTNQTLRVAGFGTSRSTEILVIGLLARLLPSLFAVAASAIAGLSLGAIALHEFTRQSYLVPVAIPIVVQLPMGLFAGLLARYRDIRKQVPKEIDPNALPELFQGVCLATDVENYTALSEATGAQELASLMNEYYETLSGHVTRRHGLMMGRAGDSAMCVWRSSQNGLLLFFNRMPGWPARQDRAERKARKDACLAAIEIREAIRVFNDRHSTTPLTTRIGLHAGEVALGPIGGEYHVVGDTPNTASRIQGVNKMLGTTLLASEAMVGALESLCTRPVGTFVLTGKAKAVALVEILGTTDSVDMGAAELCRRFAEALQLWNTGDLNMSERLFRAIASDYPSDGPTRYYLGLYEQRP